MSDRAPPAFPNTERFEILRCLGTGAHGVVYEAFDRQQQCRVALKAPTSQGPTVLQLLREEFRGLQEIKHPNVICLGELLEDDGQTILTMELVEGGDFIEHVRSRVGQDPSGQSLPPPPGSLDDQSPGSLPWCAVDEERLRDALLQLALGLVAIHTAGKVHRDLKPSNVRVTFAGRVVILDFGLICNVDESKSLESFHLVGTVAYVAPEQAAFGTVGPEADWYSVGIMLYEALTGTVPYKGNTYEIINHKLTFTPPHPNTLVRGVPDDLDQLCIDLLQFEPERRPTGEQVVQLLQTNRKMAEVPGSLSKAPEPIFVGREPELAALNAAMDRTRRYEMAAVIVQGESGIGKTALVQRFIRTTLSNDPGLVVLSGRSFEREGRAYESMAALITEMCQWFKRIPDGDVLAMLPRGTQLVSDVFPSLNSVQAVQEVPAQSLRADLGPGEQRIRLFAAVRDLFGRVAQAHRIVIVLDDLQWADADSVAMLAEVLREPDAPSLMFVGLLRTDGSGANKPALEKLMSTCKPCRLVLECLAAHDSELLISTLTEVQPSLSSDAARAIATKSGGHPLFIQEFVRFMRAHDALEAEECSLDDVLLARANELDSSAWKLLQLVAIAGRPVEREVISSATWLTSQAFRRRVRALRHANLVETADGPDIPKIWVYHDRTRRAVLERMSADEKKNAHRALAVAMESFRNQSPERLAMHWLEAGVQDRAVRHLLRAAESAEASLAFDHAVELYTTVLRMGGEASSFDVHLKLASALANRGRGADAGQAYLDAAERAEPNVKNLELKYKAAEQFLRSGHVDQALAVAHVVLRALDVPFAKTPFLALLSALMRRVVVRLRGLHFTPRSQDTISSMELSRVDVCWSLATGLSIVDTIRGADFNVRALLLALRVGEPYRVVRALANEAMYLASSGVGNRTRVQTLLESVGKLEQTLGTAPATAWYRCACGLNDYFAGNFEPAALQLEDAESVLVERCVGMAWEIDSVRYWLLSCLAHAGRWAELSRRVPQVVAESLDRGDLFCATNLRLGVLNATWLVPHQVSEARRVAREASEEWSRNGFQVQHYLSMMSNAQLDLYEGNARDAYENLAVHWPAFARSLIPRVELTRILMVQLRARVALARAYEEKGTGKRMYLAQAARYAKQVAREKPTCAKPLADLIEAGIRCMAGQTAQAVQHLEAAVLGFDSTGMRMHAAVARRRQGELVGGDEGKSLVLLANVYAAKQCIVNPSCWTAMLAPGFPNE